MSFKPSYIKLSKKSIKDKISAAEEILKNCTLCPRSCEVDRRFLCFPKNCTSVCSPIIYRVHNKYHSCLYCQNWTISHQDEGNIYSFNEFADIMMTLQNYGCHNINLVTPTHQVPMILRSLEFAIDKGLNIPLVYNCGGYESIETLKLLDGIIDIYMPDIKYADSGPAKEYSNAEDYPSVVKEAIKEMHRQVGDLTMDNTGIALRGLLVRHLVLPEGLAGTEKVVKFLVEEVSPDTYTNIMAQYYPCYKAQDHPPLDRRTTNAEYKKAVKAARHAGLKRLD